MKKTQMDYCLINTLGKANKFFADDWFGEIIIMKNKDKVKPLVNTTSDKFLRETIVLNIILLAKRGEVIVKKSSAINYGNYHLVVNNTVNVSKLDQIPVEDSVFEEQLDQKCEVKTSNLFAFGIAKMAIGIPLHKYQMCTRGNYNKAPPNSDQKSNEDNKTDWDIDDENMQ